MALESDTPRVLFTDTSQQWHRAIHATVAASRFRRGMAQSAPQQDLEASQHEPDRQASHKEEVNQAMQLDPDAPEVEVLKMIRDDLVKQLDAYGIVLVLLAGITFVAILQPPGSFNNGKLQSSVSVSLFMLFATLSFFITCTGLFAVMVGCAQLFRPFFNTKLAKYDLENSKGLFSGCLRSDIDPSGNDLPVNNLLAKRFASLVSRFKRCLGCWIVGPNHLAFEDISVLAKFCVDNVYRIRRIRIYLGLALVFCIAAYICGVLATMVTYVLQKYMLVGAMSVGGVILVYEIIKTMSAATKAATKCKTRPVQQGIQRFTT